MRNWTKKAFRLFLNSQNEGSPNHQHFKFGQRKRPYGDYLYCQDRERFNAEYAEWLKTQKP